MATRAPAPGASNFPLNVSVTVSQKDIDRVVRRLDKLQGAPLEKRVQKAIQGGMSLVVNPLRARAPVSPHGKTGKYPHPPGNLKKRIGTRSVRKKTGEIAAAYVGTRVYYGLWVQNGTRMGQRPNPFVEEVQNAYQDQVLEFVKDQVSRIDG